VLLAPPSKVSTATFAVVGTTTRSLPRYFAVTVHALGAGCTTHRDEVWLGVGTVLYALLIGPIVQFFLPVLTVRVERPAAREAEPVPAVTEPAAG
jgi:uncharacterized membrane protein YczE